MHKLRETAPFKITGPGRYRMRNGQIAHVTGLYGSVALSRDNRYIGFVGKSDQMVTWRNNGCWFEDARPDCYDLIARIPAKRTAKPKRPAKARWGVWIPCKTRQDARERCREVISGSIDFLWEAVVRKAKL